MTTKELLQDIDRGDLLKLKEGDPIKIDDNTTAVFIEWLHDGHPPLCANVIMIAGKRRVRTSRMKTT